MEITENGTYSFVPNGLDEMELDVNVAGSTTTVPDIAKVGWFGTVGLVYHDVEKNNFEVSFGMVNVPSGYALMTTTATSDNIRIVKNNSDAAKGVGFDSDTTSGYLFNVGITNGISLADNEENELLFISKGVVAVVDPYVRISKTVLTCTALTN